MKGQDKKRRRTEERGRKERKGKEEKNPEKDKELQGQRRDEKRHQTGVRGGLAGWRARCLLIEAESVMLR